MTISISSWRRARGHDFATLDAISVVPVIVMLLFPFLDNSDRLVAGEHLVTQLEDGTVQSVSRQYRWCVDVSGNAFGRGVLVSTMW